MQVNLFMVSSAGKGRPPGPMELLLRETSSLG